MSDSAPVFRLPWFFALCSCNVDDDDSMNTVCPTCLVRKECEEFLGPIAEALEADTRTH